MTDVIIEKTLVDTFLTLNEFSGINYLTDDNICLPNKLFDPPKNNRWFALSVMTNEPDPAGLGTGAKNLWTGIMQIDIYTPLNTGQTEANEKYKHISRLFGRGKVFDCVTVTKCYKAMEEAEETAYRTVVRVEFYAYLEKD